jgi:hypothetical protein
LASSFDTNGFLGGAADVSLKLNYSTTNTLGWTLASQDPISANVVPEPTSVLLLGTGLLGLAGFNFKRKRA